jgi:hypothetical protein
MFIITFSPCTIQALPTRMFYQHNPYLLSTQSISPINATIPVHYNTLTQHLVFASILYPTNTSPLISDLGKGNTEIVPPAGVTGNHQRYDTGDELSRLRVRPGYIIPLLLFQFTQIWWSLIIFVKACCLTRVAERANF